MINKFGKFATRAGEVFCGLAFAALFIVFVVQIFFRYALNDPLSWTQEVLGVLYVWIVCVGSATVVKEREHVSFNLIYESVGPRKRRFLALLGTGFILLVLLLSLYGNYDYIAFTARQKTPTLQLPMSVVFSAFGVFMVLLIANSAVRIFRLMRREWDQEP